MSNTPGSCNRGDGTEGLRAAVVKKIAEILQENGEAAPPDLGAMLFNGARGMDDILGSPLASWLKRLDGEVREAIVQELRLIVQVLDYEEGDGPDG